MRLLVTRPEPDASRTGARLTALGHRAIVQPMLRIAINPPPARLPNPGAILTTSQNAVRALETWPQMAEWRTVPAFAVGSATAEALATLGFSDIRRGAIDAATLADLVMRTLSKDVGALIHPAARERTETLVGELDAHGYDICVVEAYRADVVDRLDLHVHDALASGLVDGVLLHSGRAATALLEAAAAEGIADALRRPEYFVISERVAGILASVGGRVRVASRPDEDALFALIPAPT